MFLNFPKFRKRKFTLFGQNIVAQAVHLHILEKEKLEQKLKEREVVSEEEELMEDLVYAPFALYAQMIEMVVEKTAIQDTVYYLGQALHKGIVNIEDYLKVHSTALGRYFQFFFSLFYCVVYKVCIDWFCAYAACEDTIAQAIHNTSYSHESPTRGRVLNF